MFFGTFLESLLREKLHDMEVQVKEKGDEASSKIQAELSNVG
jgi:hypothetical protein